MARIVQNGVAFQSVRSESWRELDYESVILAHADLIFPNWVAVPFHADVVGDDGTVKRPDLALIDSLYRRWCVVEVELANHNLVNHVLPQIAVFATGAYGPQHALALYAKRPDLDLKHLEAMMTGEPPQILVVVDRPDTDWKGPLRAFGAGLSIVEPFRDTSDRLLMRINGDSPDLPSQVVTRISRSGMRRLWKIQSPASLSAHTSAQILSIILGDSPTLWARRQIGNGELLMSMKGDVLQGWKAADVLRQDDGTLRFQTVSPE